MNVKREPYLRGLDTLSQSLGGDLKDRQGLMAMGDLTKMQCLGLAQ